MEKLAISQRLRKLRTEHNLRQKEIADAIGIDRSSYSFYETGKSKPSIEKLYAISRIYNVSVGYIIGKDTEGSEISARKAEVGAGVDPIAFLSPDERALIMAYRVANDEEKEQIRKAVLEKEDDSE